MDKWRGLYKDLDLVKSIVSEYINKNMVKNKSEREKAFRDMQDDHKQMKKAMD